MWIEIMELFENGDVNDIERYFFFFFFLFPICDVNNHIGISLKRGLAILNLKELVSKDWKCKKKKVVMWIGIMELFENGDINDIEGIFFLFLPFVTFIVNNHISLIFRRSRWWNFREKGMKCFREFFNLTDFKKKKGKK